MTRIDIENRTYHVPADLNEMTAGQLIFLSELISRSIPIQEVKVKLFLFCIGGRMKRMKHSDFYRIKVGLDVFALTVEEVTECSMAFNYLFTLPDNEGNCFLDNNLINPPIPFIKSGNKKLFAPGEALTDCTYNQYIYLQTYDVMKDHNPEALYNFLGCLFRADKQQFNPEELHTRAIKKLKAEEIILTMWYWIGSCRYIADKFPRIFAPEDNSSGTGNPYDGQQRLLDFMTNADASRKKEYKLMKLYDVLYSLDIMLEQNEAKADAL